MKEETEAEGFSNSLSNNILMQEYSNGNARVFVLLEYRVGEQKPR